MMRRVGWLLLALAVVLAAYLAFWPVPIQPVPWTAPRDPGYSGVYAPNNMLIAMKRLPLEGRFGPESAAVAQNGDVYVSTRGGEILRLDAATAQFSLFADTGGSPRGLTFGKDGRLFVADADRGLLAIDGAGKVSVLADELGEGDPITNAEALDVRSDGTIYLTESTIRDFDDREAGPIATSAALLEHAGTGRLLRYDPSSRRVEVLLDGLQFADGVALTQDETALLVVETGSYRVLRLWLQGERSGEVEPLIGNLPGLPANASRANDGTFWLGLTSPRSSTVDALSGYPFLRKVLARLPQALRPVPQPYGFVLHFDQDGNILETLQDPSGSYASITGVVEGPESLLIITSLTEDSIGVLPR
ncbi:sugar lactone lactonase YvrE [Mesorhizobium sp. J18]|uniref:SMP-30/gluconolactonase/LRE family protein n=1 Tax=Mesorhizobium sp. J18 TaxID=935263 RepID=UPI0011995321|nr:SMP-30/gluconolactonase/LRE family protein [Mesorhizobium sp. J18]TWG97943.1 sugar lactone lactonase YvrE [Mesorhizobium sp. J18]